MALTVSMDDDLKKDFSTFCQEIGITPSAAITMFAKTCVRNQSFPFVPSTGNASEADIRTFERNLNEKLALSREEISLGKTYTLEEIETMRRQTGDRR